MSVLLNQLRCHKCGHMGRTNGARPCRVDPEHRDIIVMADLGACPINRHMPPGLPEPVEIVAFNMEEERERLRQGGCCGEPSAA